MATSLGLRGANVHGLAVANAGHAAVDTVENARGTTVDRDLRDAQVVVYIISILVVLVKQRGGRENTYGYACSCHST